MPELFAQGPNRENCWRKQLTDQPVILGRKEKCDWEAPWDELISRRHASLTWKDNKLHVQRLPRPDGRNPIYFKGQDVESCVVGPGECFVIGSTRFFVEEFETTPTDEGQLHNEMTCSHTELMDVKYGINAAERLEALAKLAGLLRFTPRDDAFERSVLEVLLAGIAGAAEAALVWTNPSGPISTAEVRTHDSIARRGLPAKVQPSKRLTREAIRVRRQPVLYSFGGEPPSGHHAEYTTDNEYDCHICAPLSDDPGWGLYVVGRAAESGLKEDLKFAGLVADIFGQLRQVRDLQKRRKLLESFMSPKVVAYLSTQRNQKMDDVLTPHVRNVTVLFCDLRGFSRLVEKEDDLQAVCDRVNEALRVMTRNITREKGIIGNFHGDAAMGFWGWPDEPDDQIERAASAALGILREFSQIRQIPRHPLTEFECGIGLAHGPGVAGRLGTIDQFSIGVFGPTVNIASRLESMTRHFGVPILLDDTVAQKIGTINTGLMRVRRLARVRPFGMQRTLMIHELMPPSHEPGSLPESEYADYEAALENFLAGRWSHARTLLERWAASDTPSQVLLNYIDTHQMPAKGWDGVLVMEQK